MPWTNQQIVANQVVIEGSGDYILVYNGTPGPGTLIESIGLGGTDPYGNVWLSGCVSYNSASGWASGINGGGLDVFTGPIGGAGPWTLIGTLSPTNSGTLQLSPLVAFDMNSGSAAMTVECGSFALSTAGNVSLAGANVNVGGQADFTPTTSTIGGPVTMTGGTQANPTLITSDTWHNMTLANGWGNASGTTARYRLNEDGTVTVEGTLRQAVAPTSNTFFTMPAGYRPVAQTGFGCGMNNGVNANSAPAIQIDTAGVTQIVNAVVTGNPIVWFRGSFSTI